MKAKKRKLPIAMCDQLIRLHYEIEKGPMKRHIALARIRAVLKWGGSDFAIKKEFWHHWKQWNDHPSKLR